MYAYYGALVFLLDLVQGGVAGEVLQWPCSSAREAGSSSCPLSKCSGNVNSDAHQFLGSWIGLPTRREL